MKVFFIGFNGGYDDVYKDYKVFDIDLICDEVFNFDIVKVNFEKFFDWLIDIYVDVMNIIYYMIDKYNYEVV